MGNSQREIPLRFILKNFKVKNISRYFLVYHSKLIMIQNTDFLQMCLTIIRVFFSKLIPPWFWFLQTWQVLWEIYFRSFPNFQRNLLKDKSNENIKLSLRANATVQLVLRIISIFLGHSKTSSLCRPEDSYWLLQVKLR